MISEGSDILSAYVFLLSRPAETGVSIMVAKANTSKTLAQRQDTDPEHEKAFAERIFDQEALLRMDDEGAPRKPQERS